MRQILFVLKNGQIAFWKYSRGSLARGTLNGNRWNKYSPDFWNEWSEANQAGDAVDAILLSDKPNGFGSLPDWLQEHSDESAWTVEVLRKLANDAEFKDRGLMLSQGKTKFRLVEGDAPECYSLTATLKFSLPKEAPKIESAKPTPKKPVEKSLDIIGDSYNDPEALKLSVGDELKGTIVKIFNTMKRNYVKVEGLKEQVCFKTPDKANFAVGDQVTLTVTNVDAGTKKALFSVAKS